MSKVIGRRGEIGIARETTRGTTVNPAFWIPRTTVSFDEKTITVREEQGLGVISDTDASHVTQKFGEGEVEAELYDKALGLLLYSLVGTPSTVGSDPYTHTYTLSNSNQHTSLSVLYQDPDYAVMFPNSVIDMLNIKIDQNGIVQYSFGIKSKMGREWTRQTSAYTSLGNKFLHQHLVFKLAANTAGLAAAAALSLKSLDVTIAANTIHDFVLGTITPEDVLNQQFSIEGSIELNKEDSTYRNYMLDGTYRAMQIKLSRSTSSELNVQLPRVSFTEWEQDRTLNEIVGQTIQFKAHYDAANAVEPISTLTLINSQASY